MQESLSFSWEMMPYLVVVKMQAERNPENSHPQGTRSPARGSQGRKSQVPTLCTPVLLPLGLHLFLLALHWVGVLRGGFLGGSSCFWLQFQRLAQIIT